MGLMSKVMPDAKVGGKGMENNDEKGVIVDDSRAEGAWVNREVRGGHCSELADLNLR